MADDFAKMSQMKGENDEKSLELLSKLAEAARPEAVFGRPVKIGDTQIITASEVQVGLGFGFGLGSGPRFISNFKEGPENIEDSTGMGRGGGGGGGASGRPVAVITVKDDGVKIEPVFDTTKIALAFFTMLGSIFFMGAQMRKKS